MTTRETALSQREATSLDQPEQPNVIAMTPPVDIYENQDEILLVADFPGVPNDSLSIRLDRSELVIEGTQTGPAGHAPSQVLAFVRTFRVPNTVDPNGIRAELARGVLRVHLAKSESAKPKRIEVRSS